MTQIIGRGTASVVSSAMPNQAETIQAMIELRYITGISGIPPIVAESEGKVPAISQKVREHMLTQEETINMMAQWRKEMRI